MRDEDLSPQRLDQSGYLSEDTIAAISTALGGAVAVIRMSGPGAFKALQSILRDPNPRLVAEPRKLFRANLVDNERRPLDDALVACFVGPQSFTGEDCVELHIHGSPFIATRLLESLAQASVRQALPGEFSFRAVRNGKMNLSQAEATADLIASANEGAVQLALEKMSGAQSQMIGALAEDLRVLAMLSEAGIDFSDQDLDEVSQPTLGKRLIPILQKLQVLEASYQRGVKLQEGVKIAFVGLPNAGKSSFFNALLGEDRSIVSEVAGTTRDVVREKLTLRGTHSSITLRLEDTAGLRSTTDKVETIGIERTQKAALESDLVLFLIDSSTPGLVPAALEEWDRLGKPIGKAVGVFTKTDLIAAKQLDDLRSQVSVFGLNLWLETSATTGVGIHGAAQGIADYCEKWVHRSQGEILLTRLDHRRMVSEAVEHLQRAKLTAEIDLFAADLKQALYVLGPLIGDTPPDEILGRIFTQFCIGK